MVSAAIVHGTMGSPQGNWFPWLKTELEKRSVAVTVPAMPTPEGQTLQGWRSAFADQVGALNTGSLLIGHSVGAVFALRYLESCKIPIGAVFLVVFLVAGFTGTLGLSEYDALNASFVDGTYDWAAIERNAKKIFCISGDNDPYVPLSQGQEIARELGVEHHIIRGGGHLNAEFGYTRFPELLELCASVIT